MTRYGWSMGWLIVLLAVFAKTASAQFTAQDEQVLSVLSNPPPDYYGETPEAYFRQWPIDIRIDRVDLANAGSDFDLFSTTLFRPIQGQTMIGYLNDLRTFELDWSIKGDGVELTSRRENNPRKIGVYDVSKLVTSFPTDRNRGHKNFGPLLRLLCETIDPDDWNATGGNNSIVPYEYNGRSLIIVGCPISTHLQIRDLLARMQPAGFSHSKPRPSSTTSKIKRRS